MIVTNVKLNGEGRMQYTFESHLHRFVFFHCTKMYPIALICVLPYFASFPQVLESSCFPPVPNPILESQVLQSFSLFPRIPMRAFGLLGSSHFTLNPSWSQLDCNDALEPISFFHVSRPNEVVRPFPSAIKE